MFSKHPQHPLGNHLVSKHPTSSPKDLCHVLRQRGPFLQSLVRPSQGSLPNSTSLRVSTPQLDHLAGSTGSNISPYRCCWRCPWENRRESQGLLCGNKNKTISLNTFWVISRHESVLKAIAHRTSAAHLVKGAAVAEVRRVVLTGLSFQCTGQTRFEPVFCQPAHGRKNIWTLELIFTN